MTGDSPPGPVGSGAMPHLKPAFGISEAREIWLIVIAAVAGEVVALFARRHDRLVLEDHVVQLLTAATASGLSKPHCLLAQTSPPSARIGGISACMMRVS